MSHVIKTLYDQLGVKGIRSTPYHPETDGLVGQNVIKENVEKVY